MLFTSLKPDLVATLAPHTPLKGNLSVFLWCLVADMFQYILWCFPVHGNPSAAAEYVLIRLSDPSLQDFAKEAFLIWAGLRSGNLPSESFSRRIYTCHKIKTSQLKMWQRLLSIHPPCWTGSTHRLPGCLASLEPVRQISVTGALGIDPGLTCSLTLEYFRKPHISASLLGIQRIWKLLKTFRNTETEWGFDCCKIKY